MYRFFYHGQPPNNFSGIAASILAVINSSLEDILSGTIIAAAIINEIIAKMGFKWCHENEKTIEMPKG